MRVARILGVCSLIGIACGLLAYVAALFFAAPLNVEVRSVPGGLDVSFLPPRAFTPDFYLVTVPKCLNSSPSSCATYAQLWEGRGRDPRKVSIVLSAQERLVCEFSVSACTAYGRCGPTVERACR
jgi:hypothetical protein